MSLAKPPRPRPGFILLAGGASARLGRPKQLVPVGGQPLVVRALSAGLAADVWPIIVVLGAHADLVRPLLAPYPVLVAENPAWSEGMASSVRSGVATLESFSRAIDAVVVAVCDQPAFGPQHVTALISASNAHRTSVGAARYNGRLGVPALFTRRHFPELAALQGDAGARSLLVRAAEANDLAAIDAPELGFDIDLPADYERLREAGSLAPGP